MYWLDVVNSALPRFGILLGSGTYSQDLVYCLAVVYTVLSRFGVLFGCGKYGIAKIWYFAWLW